MRHLLLDGHGRLAWAPAAPPRLTSPTAALVRPVAAATCDFDHLLVAGRMPLPGPIAIGHEMVAEVTAVGADVGSIRVGDLVIVPFQVSCGTCRNCARGLTSACTEVPWLSCYGLGPLAGDWGSAVSELVGVPWAEAMLVPLPGGVDATVAAAVSCNVPDAYRAVAPIRHRAGGSVFVTGGAFANISHYAVLLARALGASRVDYFSHDPDQASKAERLGAHVVDSPSEVETEAYEVVVDNSQNPEVLALAVNAAAPAAVVTSTAMYVDARTPVPLMDMFARGITYVTGQPHARHDIGRLVPLLRDGVDLAPVVTAVAAWDDAPEAFASGSGKLVCARP